MPHGNKIKQEMGTLWWTQAYKNKLNRKLIDAHARLLLPVLLAIERGLRYRMCDLHSKFEEQQKLWLLC